MLPMGKAIRNGFAIVPSWVLHDLRSNRKTYVHPANLQSEKFSSDQGESVYLVCFFDNNSFPSLSFASNIKDSTKQGGK